MNALQNANPPMMSGGATNCASRLTTRQRQIMQLVLAGHPSKNIAADLAISQRTVESHRAAIMKTMGAASVVGLVRVALQVEFLEIEPCMSRSLSNPRH